MQNKNISNINTSSKNPSHFSSNNKIPASSNGYGLSTAQLHQLLSNDQLNINLSPFDKAIQKQQQLFNICNTLDRQNNIHSEVAHLFNSDHGVHWLDSQISEFKAHCPTQVLKQLSQPSILLSHQIENTDSLNQNYFNLLNENIFVPLTILKTLTFNELSQSERKQWSDWCLQLKTQLASYKSEIELTKSFFTLKIFNKIYDLADDNTSRQQLENIKYLFEPVSLTFDNHKYND